MPFLIWAFLLVLNSCTLGSSDDDSHVVSGVRLLSESQMNEMGEQSYLSIKSKTKISSDLVMKEKILRIGRRIAKASGKNYNWEFELFDEPKTVNAFCLPGGKIGVYTGIIPIAKNEAGLAAALGHEVAHAPLSHGNERVSQGLIASIGFAAIEAVLGDSRNRDVILGGLGIGAQFGILLPFSRSHESAADQVGTQYMAKAGYDPREAKELWIRMAGTGGKVPEFMSTHPDPLRRAKVLEQNLSEFLPMYQVSEKQPSRPL
ncbi:MAG: M48 family metallopeptidase [Pseudomonadota bacterium]